MLNIPQAPTPFSENKINENNSNPNIKKESKEFKLSFNNKEFKIKIDLNEEKQLINISSILNEEIARIEYIKDLSMEELIIKNKLFKSFDIINEAFNLLNELFEKNKISIKEYIENSIIKLEIKLSSLSGEEQTFDIELYKKEVNKDIIINKLI